MNFSELIRILRFPLIVGIVLLHTYIIDYPIGGQVLASSEQFPFSNLIIYILKSDLAGAFVPLFFFISGYLFFYKIPAFNLKIYFSKLHKRVYSLAIPFFLWNILYILFVVLLSIVFPSLLTSKQSIFDMAFTEAIYEAFWTLNQGLIPLWFIRDLIILSLFTLPLYWFLKGEKGIIFVAFLGVLFVIPHFHYLGLRSLFPFALGALFSINNQDPLDIFNQYKLIIIPLAVFLIMLDSLIISSNQPQNFILNRVTLIAIIMAIPIITYHLYSLRIIRHHPILEKGAFFVFVFHMFIIYIPTKLWVYVLPINTFTIILVQLLIPGVISTICILIYLMLNKFFPKTMNLVMGNRK